MKKAKSRLKQRENKLAGLTLATAIITIELWLMVFRYIGELQEVDTVSAYQKPVVVYQAKSKQAPTAELAYTPSKKARAHIAKHPGITGKLKNVFGSDWVYAAEIVARESSFNPQAVNGESGACGLFQSYPCQKMACDLSDTDCQVRWGADYINNRYGDAQAAWDFWQMKGWY